MAIFYCNASIVSRAAGQSVTRRAAYNARMKIHDRAKNETYNYSKKPSVIAEDIAFPEGSPSWVYDREELYNRIEEKEFESKRYATAQLARNIILALPNELSDEENINLMKDVSKIFTNQGMGVDWNIHDEKEEPRNIHAHLLVTLREITPEGFGNKNRQWNDRTFFQEQIKNKIGDLINQRLRKYGIQEIDPRPFEIQNEGKPESEKKIATRHKGYEAVVEKRIIEYENEQARITQRDQKAKPADTPKPVQIEKPVQPEKQEAKPAPDPVDQIVTGYESADDKPSYLKQQEQGKKYFETLATVNATIQSLPIITKAVNADIAENQKAIYSHNINIPVVKMDPTEKQEKQILESKEAVYLVNLINAGIKIQEYHKKSLLPKEYPDTKNIYHTSYEGYLSHQKTINRDYEEEAKALNEKKKEMENEKKQCAELANLNITPPHQNKEMEKDRRKKIWIIAQKVLHDQWEKRPKVYEQIKQKAETALATGAEFIKYRVIKKAIDKITEIIKKEKQQERQNQNIQKPNRGGISR